MADRGSVSREGDMAVIRIPLSQVFDLRVALNCPCGATKSTKTEQTRKRLDRALAALTAGRK